MRSLTPRLGELARSWPLVHAASPLNWASEIARLTEARRRGQVAQPRFVYPESRPDPELPERLGELADALDLRGPEQGGLARSARLLAVELAMIRAIDTPPFCALAQRRFGCSVEDDQRALAWARSDAAPGDSTRVRSDDERDPRSLLSQVRALLTRHALPARVVVRRDLPSLAATGEGLVLVVAGRDLDPQVCLRAALHEVQGHVAPWWERRSGLRPADRLPDALDREEGEALRIEERAGLLDPRRRKELGLRHVAARMAHEARPFDEIASCMEDLDSTVEEAVRIAARAVRGGGLGRERVYLPSLWALASG